MYSFDDFAVRRLNVTAVVVKTQEKERRFSITQIDYKALIFMAHLQIALGMQAY